MKIWQSNILFILANSSSLKPIFTALLLLYFLLYLVTVDGKLEEIGPFVWVFLFQLTKQKKDFLIEKSAEIQHKFIQNLSKSSKEK